MAPIATTAMTLRVPPPLRKKLEGRAAKDGLSLNATVIALLVAGLEATR